MDAWQTRGLESKEDYLEAILLLTKEGVIRSVDLARHMGFSKASISIAVSNLKKSGLLEVSLNGALHLTPNGKAAAERVYERHKVLTTAFIQLGVDEETARRDACRIEHIISEESFECLRSHVNE